MENTSYQLFDGKVIIRLRDRCCEHAEELLTSELFLVILKRCIDDLTKRESNLLNFFDHKEITPQDYRLLIKTFQFLTKLPAELVMKVLPGSEQFFHSPAILNDFVEYVYNYWRSLQRLIICDSEGDRLDKRPYRTFNTTIEQLTHVVRGTYRDLQENITGDHPRIYRQVRSGAEIATIALPKEVDFPDGVYQNLKDLSIIRQVLIYPPLIFNPPMNKRTGVFERVDRNPLENMPVHKEDWLCYPAKVGPLLIMIYFSIHFFELGFSLSNLFELAEEEDLKRRPDAIFFYGTPPDFPLPGNSKTVFYDDLENDILVGAIPDADQFGYFGYLKKMALTLHNIRMMKLGRMPYHGAMVNLRLHSSGMHTVMLMGDTGTGKSETLEALRTIGGEDIEDITIIADDMGSVEINAEGNVLGYGTETGAFVRLDDLQPGYAFGQIDRTIIMSPNQVNARVVLPVTTYANIVKGFSVDMVLYANNFEDVDESHPIVERFTSADQALETFRSGVAMSKGTTTSTGLVHSYFANVFGPEQYQDVHEGIARRYFAQFFKKEIFVGALRTRLGIAGQEHQGPEDAARALLQVLKELPVSK